MSEQSSVTNPEARAFDNIPECDDDAPAIVNSDPLWDMERCWRRLSYKYDDIPAKCFEQCANELRAMLLSGSSLVAALKYALTIGSSATIRAWLDTHAPSTEECDACWSAVMRARRGTPRRVDGNHAEIVAVFKAAGCSVMDLAAVGGGVPDLLICAPDGRSYLVEIKNPKARGKLNKLQTKFFASWPGEIQLVRSVDDALQTIRRVT